MTYDVDAKAREIMGLGESDGSGWRTGYAKKIAAALREAQAALIMGASPDASPDAKEYRAAVERACDENMSRYKHEAREARETALREAAATVGTMAERPYDNEPEFIAILAAEAAILALIDRKG